MARSAKSGTNTKNNDCGAIQFSSKPPSSPPNTPLLGPDSALIDAAWLKPIVSPNCANSVRLMICSKPRPHPPGRAQDEDRARAMRADPAACRGRQNQHANALRQSHCREHLRGILPTVFPGSIVMQQLHPAGGVVEIVAMYGPQLVGQRFEVVWQVIVDSHHVGPPVSPPSSGNVTARRMDNLGGRTSKVTSVCQELARPPRCEWSSSIEGSSWAATVG